MTTVSFRRLILFSFETALIVTAFAVVPLVDFPSQSRAAGSDRPNIIFMFTDDQPANCLGAMGNSYIQTPNVDALAQRGVMFRNAFATTAICCCNRACLLTGQHMIRHGIRDFQTPLSAEAFAKTYPAVLRQHGYRTAFLGKYAIGRASAELRELSLPAKKFDFWYGFDQSISFLQKFNDEPYYLTELMTEKAIDFMKANPPDQPFCMAIAFKEPHGPFSYFDPNSPDPYASVDIPPSPTCTESDWAAQPEFIQKSLGGNGAVNRIKKSESYQKELRTHYRMVTRADEAVGEILAALKELKIDKNTVIVYSSDHGHLSGDHGLNGKWLMYENSIRVPMVIYDPRLDESLVGKVRDEMVLSIDIAPTLIDLAGTAIPSEMQGRSLTPLIRNEPVQWRSSFYYEHTYQTEPPRSPIPRTEGIRTTDWKYIRYPDIEPVYEQLFDLANDPLERVNLVKSVAHNEKLVELRGMCDAAPAELR